MLRPPRRRAPRREYHERLLLVKSRGGALGEIAGARRGPADAEPLGPLDALVRAGLVRRIVPALPPRERPVRRGPAAEPEALSHGRSLLLGLSLVETVREADVETARRELAKDARVLFVTRVPVRYAQGAPRAAPKRVARSARGAAPPASALWNLAKIEWPAARALASFRDADAVKVAVLDTGVDEKHPDLAGRIASYRFRHADLPSASDRHDLVGHGTHVAGILAAGADNGIGVAGICAPSLSVWKIFGDETVFLDWDEGFAYVVDPLMYLRALADCVDEDVDVLNLSVGGPAPPEPEELELFAALHEGGTLVVAAMGNERELGSPTVYPAALPGVIAVGASGLDDRVTSFSSRGEHIALVAPGRAIWSTLPTTAGQHGFDAVEGKDGRPREGRRWQRQTDYDAWDGTSMAAPHVAGALALWLANGGERSPAAARRALAASCDTTKEMKGKDADYGAGRLNLRRLLEGAHEGRAHEGRARGGRPRGARRRAR